MQSRLTLRYLLGEMIPPFFLGVLVFVLILLMFQALRLTEFVLIHGVKLTVIFQMMTYLSTSFLPVLFPMSLLFTVILTYGRLSADSEIVAMKAVGLSMWQILSPALVLSVMIAALSAQMAFQVAPWGNRQFELLVTKIGAMKPSVTIKEGTFSEGFFNLVVYAAKVDNKTGFLQNVFIYDESNRASPTTIIAKKGLLVLDPEHPGHNASLRLNEGSIHRVADGRHTKINFSSYEVYLSDPINESYRHKSPPSLTLDDIRTNLAKTDLPEEDRRINLIEFHKRWAISIACILFGLIGVGLGTTTNRRNAKSGGAVMCLGLIVAYWIMYILGENLAKNGIVPPGLSMWIADGLFSIAAFFSLRRAWT